MTATSQAGTPSSTIMTRLSVPISSTTAMPTVTWNRLSRSSRAIGSSAEAASANGMNPVPIRPQVRTAASLSRAIIGNPMHTYARHGRT